MPALASSTMYIFLISLYRDTMNLTGGAGDDVLKPF